MTFKNILPFFILLLAGTGAYAQEDCGNGLDDDGDGLIDCNDPDCTGGTVPTGAFFNTATDGSGGILPGASDDLNWEISTTTPAGPYAPAIVMSSKPGSYYDSPWPDCDWISYTEDGVHFDLVDHYYRIQFYLPCENACGASYSTDGTFCLNMDFFCDNSVDEIYVNGVPQGAGIPGVPAADPYGNVGFVAGTQISISLCNDWQPGLNQLIIKVSSGPGYTGFLAQNSVDAPPPSDDPTIVTPPGGTTTCITAPPIDLNAASPGGIWTADCGGCVNAATGVFNPSVAGVGTHTVIYSLAVPCPVSDTIAITVTDTTDLVVTSPFDKVCTYNTPFALSANLTGGAWAGSGMTATGIFNPATAGIGTHNITYTIGGLCPQNENVLIEVNELSIESFTTEKTCFGSSNGSITTVTVSNVPVTYALNIPEIQSNATGAFYGLAAGEYLVVAVNEAGCSDTIEAIVESFPPVLAQLNTPAPVCQGETVTLTASGGTSYTWSPTALFHGTTAQTVSFVPMENVTVTVTASDNTCSDTATTHIVVNIPAPVDAGPGFVYDMGTGPLLDPTVQLPGSFYWTPSSGLSCTSCLNSEARPEASTVYYLWFTDENGCTGMDSTVVLVTPTLYVPNAFSPNGDGMNEVFLPVGRNLSWYQLNIFDRWGNLVFSTEDSTKAWDGTHQGKKMKEDTYVWKIVYESLLEPGLRNERRGHVVLLK